MQCNASWLYYIDNISACVTTILYYNTCSSVGAGVYTATVHIYDGEARSAWDIWKKPNLLSIIHSHDVLMLLFINLGTSKIHLPEDFRK